jgi:hypothetical protein
MYEQDATGLLKEMAERKILVEICLTSNDEILDVRGKAHPLSTYIKYGVPVALATDDEGVSRSEITKEYLRAVEDQGLTYSQLKTMARASLEYSFASGLSLWKNREGYTPVPQCASDFANSPIGQIDNQTHHSNPSPLCRAYLDSNEKAKLQWSLEEQFRQFEKSMGGTTKP